MTIEERAGEYIKKNNLEWELECNRTSPIGEVKQAYIAGAKETLKMKVNTTTISDAPLEDKRKLEEANVIIKLLLWDLRNRSHEPLKDIERAEQFLKED